MAISTTTTTRRGLLGSLALGAVVAAGAALTLHSGSAQAAGQPTVVKLTQVGCQFVESENGVDHNYKTTKKADCEAINAKSGKERLAKAKVIKLKAGDYVFRVTNKNVPYELGFWIRGQGISRVTLPSTSGGGLVTGKTQDYKISLKPGKYYYSCPLNSTPDYTLIVEG